MKKARNYSPLGIGHPLSRESQTEGAQDMTLTESSSGERFYTKLELAERYRVNPRTIDRWRDTGRYPTPDLVLPNGAPRWSDKIVVAHEHASVGKTAA